MNFQNAVCKGSWALGTACGSCERCDQTRNALIIDPAPVEDLSEISHGPVQILVPLEALREVHAALVECAQDLQCSVDAEYANQMDYPTGQRRHARDREPANRAMHLAQAMQTWDGFNVI